MYRNSVMETEEIKRQVMELLEVGIIKPAVPHATRQSFWYRKRMADGGCVWIFGRSTKLQSRTTTLSLGLMTYWISCVMPRCSLSLTSNRGTIKFEFGRKTPGRQLSKPDKGYSNSWLCHLDYAIPLPL